jgi:chemotaxis protein methyltransferase CheR
MAILPSRPTALPILITEGEYRKFCEFFYRATGISFGDNKRYFVDKRLIDRIEKTGLLNFADYFDKLRRRDATPEIERLINLLTVNETYFYREEHQFECLVHGILPELTAKRRRGERIRNWSQVDDYDIEIIGSDIDTNALLAAEAGVYDKRSLHRLTPDMTRRYFTAAGHDRYRLIEDIRGSVSFTQINVSDPVAMRAFGHLDVIFCRNMLIYFDDASRLKTIECFYDSMVGGGFICLGHSESMSRISSLFKVRTFPQAIVYQKTGGPR